MRTLELTYSIFDEFEVIAFGISVDSSQSKKAWATSMGVKDTNLLADVTIHRVNCPIAAMP
jgi:peroxiredoxin